MPYAFIGVGQCGGAIIDSAFSDRFMFSIAVPVAINSATLDLETLANVPRECWIGISRERGFIPGSTPGFRHLVSGGYGKNRKLAEEHAITHRETLREVLLQVLGGEDEAVPVGVVAFSMGGGTGSGAGPVVARLLKEMNIPVVAVAVLPASHEGGLSAKNAVECLNALIDSADSVILVDNQKIAHSETMEALFRKYNSYVARGICDILAGTAKEGIGAEEQSYAPVLDLKDMISATTFSAGRRTLPGFAALGRASERTRGFLHYLFPFGGYREVDVVSLLYRSFMKLTVSGVAPEQAEKNLALLRVPPAYLSDTGRINTSMAKEVMEEHSRIGETHFGVAMTRRNIASATVLMTYRPAQIGRFEELERLAAQHQEVTLKVFEEYERRGEE